MIYTRLIRNSLAITYNKCPLQDAVPAVPAQGAQTNPAAQTGNTNPVKAGGSGMSAGAAQGIQAGINMTSGFLNNIAGASNKVGDTLNTLGDAAAMAPPPYGLIASGVLKTAGFIANGFTDSVNEQQVKQKNAEIGASSQQLSHATTYEDLVADANSFTNVDLGGLDEWGDKGIFVSEAGSKRAKARNEANLYAQAAIQTQQKNLQNTENNIQQENMHDSLMNIVAKGGKIHRVDIGLGEDLINTSRSKKNRLINRKSKYTEGAPNINDILDFKDEAELDAYLKEHNLDRTNIEILS